MPIYYGWGHKKKPMTRRNSSNFLFLVETFPTSFTERGGRVNAKCREKALFIFFCYIFPFLVLSPIVEKRSNDRMGTALICFFLIYAIIIFSFSECRILHLIFQNFLGNHVPKPHFQVTYDWCCVSSV